MKIFRTFLLVTGLLMVPVNLAAQDDPFAQAQDDPFAQEGSLDDPFGGAKQKPGTDPFAGPATSGSDPFASADSDQASDPFGEDSDRKGVRSVQSKSKSKRQPKKIDCNKANDRIRETLSHSTTQVFDETPLIEAIREIAEAHDIPIVVEGWALEEIGLSKEEPITIALENVSLRSFLRLMLRDHDLTYVIRDEVMLITTIESAQQNLELRTYRLIPPIAAESEEVISALQKSVMPNAWDAQGGHACVASVLGNVLVVAGTETLHDKVQDFLDKIDAALEQQQ